MHELRSGSLIWKFRSKEKGTVDVFEDQTTASKANATLLLVINKEGMCARCIHRLNCIKIHAVDAFTS